MNQQSKKRFERERIKLLKGILLLIGVIIISVNFTSASSGDVYKTYLHNPVVPKHPNLALQGDYQTALWPGAATFNYPIQVASGTNGLAPLLTISYNHQLTSGRPSIAGAGCSLLENYIWRDVNYTFANVSDDKFKLSLNGQVFNLVYVASEARWHTEIESYFYIQNLSGGNNTNGQYWIVKSPDGTNYRFGFNNNSELVSNLYSYTVKWDLDLINDTHNNNIYYSYLKNPYANDLGAIYTDKIQYNNDKNRSIEFVYDSLDRPDIWTVYENGNKIKESRRLKEIRIKTNGNLVRKYAINYTLLDSKSFIQSIALFGNDNITSLLPVIFDYYSPTAGWYTDSNYNLPNPSSLKFEANGSDYGARLVDLNRDGLIDIVKADGKNPNDNQTWINNGTGWIRNDAWNIPYLIVDNQQNDTGLRFIDVNADGFTDIVIGDGSFRKSWINNGTGWILNSNWNLPTNANPIDSTNKIFERGVRFEDLNGDGFIDILAATDQWNYAWINNGTGWTLDSSWNVPSDAIFISYSQGKDLGVRIIDVNGDGLPDLVMSSSTSQRTWINNGHGWTENSAYQIPLGMEFVDSAGKDTGVRLADFNGDGLIDLTKRKSSDTKQTWINNGTGWIRNDSWNVPGGADFVDSSGSNKAVRIVDVNGDGLVDLMNGDSDNLVTFINKKAIRPYLLKKITDNLGGSNTIDYGISTTINNKDSNNISAMGFNLWVVGNVKEDNGLLDVHNLSSTINYYYSGGYYDYNKKEFRGFNHVDEINQNISIIKHWFYQNDSLKGKEYISEIYDSNSNPFKIISYEWNGTLQNNYYINTISKGADYLYDGVYNNPKITEIRYSYDSYGNILSINNSGDNSTQGDEKIEYFNYIYNTNNWIINLPKNYSIYDSNNIKMRKTFYRYDNLNYGDSPTKGDLTWKELWLNTGANPITKYGYDNYGNLANQTDSNNHLTKYIYGLRDSTNTFADQIINAKNHIVNYYYDLGTGNLLSFVDANNYATNYTYDIFGRVKKEMLPYDNVNYPTKEYNYSLDGIAPESIKIMQREKSNQPGTLDSYYYYDGLSNLIQTKKEAGNNNQIVNDIYYDSLKRVIKQGNPYFASVNESYSNPNSSINAIEYSYDSLSRVIKLRNQDNSTINITFDHWKISQYDENGNKKVYYPDAYNQINKIIEYVGNNHFATKYSYSSVGELLQINDSNGNTILNYTYDSLGRKISQDNIDTGTWKYYYDNVGNLLNQTDARGINITLQYDELDRIIRKNSSNIYINFSYDLINGTLWKIESPVFTINYSYDNRLRKTNETRFIDGKIYKKGWIYDSLDRLNSEKLPDNYIINYNYSSTGLLTQISDILNNVEYNQPIDKPTRLVYSNNLETNYSYDSARFRINQIKTGNKQILNYNYDSVGNILGINDGSKTLTENMSYDKLDQLIISKKSNNTYIDFNFNYIYDNLGNILNNSGINNEIAYYYGKKPNHAPLKITSPYPLWSVPSTINFCKTIIYPNRVYYLGKNISSAGTCINITANNVTLDGQGYTINYGIKNSGNGVYSQNRNYLLIRNMSIYLNNVSRRSSPGIDFENSSYDNLTSLKIFIKGDSMTSGSHCEGINLVTVTNSYIDKCFINTTNTRDSDGIRMTTSGSYDGPIANNKITNSEVYVYGDGSSGLKMIDYRNDRILDILVDKSKFYSKSYSCIYLQGNSIKSNNFNMNNTLVQSNYYGISITNADNNLISNSNISNITISSSDQNILLNTSYLSEGVSSGTLIRKWYFNAQVNYSNGTFVNQANVTAWNISGNWQFSELTDSSGQISQKELIEYVNNGAAKIYYTNYTINATKNGIVAQQSFNLTGNLNLLLTLDLLELNDTHKYYHKDSLGNAVAWLGNKGNIVLKGKCFSGGTCNNPGDGSLIFRNESNYNLGFINITGDLCITKGDCSDESSNCNSPADGAFIIANSTSYVSYIDGEGDLCLTGKLYESSSP